MRKDISRTGNDGCLHGGIEAIFFIEELVPCIGDFWTFTACAFHLIIVVLLRIHRSAVPHSRPLERVQSSSCNGPYCVGFHTCAVELCDVFLGCSACSARCRTSCSQVLGASRTEFCTWHEDFETPCSVRRQQTASTTPKTHRRADLQWPLVDMMCQNQWAINLNL